MSGLIISVEKIKLYEYLNEICSITGYDDSFRDKLWEGLLSHKDVYDEFLYWADHQDFLLECKVAGNTIIDIMVWEMRKYNVRTDRGKNGSDCDKLAMILSAFMEMLEKIENGDDLNKDMENRNGMDRM